MRRHLRRWSVPGILACAVVAALAGCASGQSGDPMTVAPVPPIGHVQGATLPRQVAGYSVLGGLPKAGQLEATYALDTDGTALAVVTLTEDRAHLQTPLVDDAWIGQSRCGVLDELDDDLAQAACITPLVDGVLTVVGTAVQTPEDLAVLANAVAAGLP
ncbi:MAG: hypothetical protein LBR33_05270 [Propionibacteriaceae bacterium]|jgi:hypothetical protein|nr:hypothetical protein [Propionibacteriaceae bacterium]